MYILEFFFWYTIYGRNTWSTVRIVPYHRELVSHTRGILFFVDRIRMLIISITYIYMLYGRGRIVNESIVRIWFWPVGMSRAKLTVVSDLRLRWSQRFRLVGNSNYSKVVWLEQKTSTCVIAIALGQTEHAKDNQTICRFLTLTREVIE